MGKAKARTDQKRRRQCPPSRPRAVKRAVLVRGGGILWGWELESEPGGEAEEGVGVEEGEAGFEWKEETPGAGGVEGGDRRGNGSRGERTGAPLAAFETLGWDGMVWEVFVLGSCLFSRSI